MKLKDLIEKKIKEIEFGNKSDFAKYSAKHKMRKSTKVTIGGKKTTAGDAQKNTKKKDDDGFDVGGPAHPNVQRVQNLLKTLRK